MVFAVRYTTQAEYLRARTIGQLVDFPQVSRVSNADSSTLHLPIKATWVYQARLIQAPQSLEDFIQAGLRHFL